MNSINKKKQWAVYLGEPTGIHSDPSAALHRNVLYGVERFYTKQEAQKIADEYAKNNTWWTYYPKKVGTKS